MLVSESWLREWVSPRLSTGELADRLTRGGLEVAGIERAGPQLSRNKFVVGEVVSCESHPDSNKLKLCRVDSGLRSAHQIICGARNVAAGQKVVVARLGARIGEITIEKRKIRGVESSGMICSAAELGLEEQSDGILELDADAPVGVPIVEHLQLDDQVIEIELTPNRGDCLGMLGIARDVSALTGAKFRERPDPKVRAINKERLDVDLQSPLACPRYVGRAIRNIDMAARTPDWMVERLRRSGLRSINVVVDITNYILMELGQPMHAFDLDRIRGGIVVRMARKNEKLKLLDGSTVRLGPENCVIADHERAIALAGIMGGDNSAISDSTRHIYFEAAYFPAASIQGKARTFGMHTDASHRFERGADPAIQARAMERATQLLIELAGGEPGPVTDARIAASMPRSKRIRFSRDEIPRLLGTGVPARTVTAILNRLGMKTSTAANGWNVVVPSWRSDISGQHDLVEEVGRCYGFDRIEPRMPAATAVTGRHPEGLNTLDEFKNVLVQQGYHEAITYSFVDPASEKALSGNASAIRLANPIADNMAVMRQSLWPGLLEAVRNNLSRQHDRVRLFESGHVFFRGSRKTGRREIMRLGGAVTGPVLPRQWGEPSRLVDFFDIKGDVESLVGAASLVGEVKFVSADHAALHPGQSARMLIGKSTIGWLGKLHPAQQKSLEINQPVYLFEIDLDYLARGQLPVFESISRYPSVQRDLAVVVDAGVQVQDMLDTVQSVAGELLQNLELFDIYQGERIEKNRKSFAFSLTFQSGSSNLTANEVESITDNIIRALQEELGANLRT